jgi:hypothetical protein
MALHFFCFTLGWRDFFRMVCVLHFVYFGAGRTVPVLTHLRQSFGAAQTKVCLSVSRSERKGGGLD